MEGPGIYLDNSNHTIFNGQMIQDKKESGTLKMAGGEEYNGRFDEDGLFTGYSELKWKTGKRYHGDFKAGLIEGQGVMRYSNGNKFTGLFVDGQISEGEMLYGQD